MLVQIGLECTVVATSSKPIARVLWLLLTDAHQRVARHLTEAHIGAALPSTSAAWKDTPGAYQAYW